jgi:hypothetical protein
MKYITENQWCNFAFKNGGMKLILPFPPLLSLAVKEKKWGMLTPVDYAC